MIRPFTKIIGLLLIPFNSYKWKYLTYLIYTARFSRSFKNFGNNSVIVPKLRNITGQKYISIGDNSYIGTQVTLTAWDRFQEQTFKPEIVIGNNSCIGDFSHVTSINRIIIGNNVLMGKSILITDNSHGDNSLNHLATPPNKRPLVSKGEVIIEDNVWIGEKSSILPGVRIGYGSIIAANSVVTKDIPPCCIAGGNPAKVIRKIS